MNQNVAAGVVVAFLALLAVVALLVGEGRAVSVQVDSSSIDAPEVDGGGIVYGKHENGGIVLFGLELRARDRWFAVGFVAPEECIEPDDTGNQVVIESGDCGSLPGWGLIEGGGITADQVEWVIVRVDVARQCFEVVSVGDAWPSDAAECREG